MPKRVKTSDKKRDPALEPFPAKITDAARERLIQRAKSNDLTESEAIILWDDYTRAIEKRVAAVRAQTTPDQLSEFAAPDVSEHSAVATVDTLASTVDDWIITGAKAKHQRKEALEPDESVIRRHEAWERAYHAILKERQASGRIPSARQMAKLIRTQVPGSNEHTVRGYFARKKRKLK